MAYLQFPAKKLLLFNSMLTETEYNYCSLDTKNSNARNATLQKQTPIKSF